MRILISIIFISIFSINILSQSVKKADFLQSKGYFEEAIEIYENKLIKSKKPKVNNHIYKKLAFCYNELHNEEDAYKYFSKINKEYRNTKDLYLGFQLLRSLKKYEEAHNLLNSSDSLKNLHNLVEISQWSIDKISETDGSYEIFNTNLKTKGHSFGYALDNDGKFYFSTLINNDENNEEKAITQFYDLYKYTLKNDSTFDIKNKERVIKDEKRIFYRGTPSITSNNKHIYFTTNSSESNKYTKTNAEKREVSSDGENILKIFKYNLEKNTTESLPINSNEYHNCFPYLYKDSILFFSSSINAEKTKLDIFYIVKQNQQWSSPIPLKSVNTFEDEVYPFVFEDKFYFSSRGREGFGGMDIYVGELTFDENGSLDVINIENLLQPINSSKDDFAYYMNNKEGGYISSNRVGKKGEDRIYFFSKSIGDSINGNIIDAITKKDISNVIYTIKEKKGDEWVEINSENLDLASFFSEIDPNKNYLISFNKEGYHNQEFQIPNSRFEELRNDVKEFIKEIELEPINNNPYIYDDLTNEPVEGALVVVKHKTLGTTLAEVKTDKDGNWYYDFNIEEVEIDVLKDGYEKLTIDMEEWNDPNSRNYKKTAIIPLHSTGDKMTINNIYFEFDSYKIRPESYKVLNNIVKFMNKHSHLKFELGAHTDCKGSNEYNESLSSKRANSCWKYLISAGIHKDRMKPKGYGERVPKHPCEEQRKDKKKALLNRRIEITIL